MSDATARVGMTVTDRTVEGIREVLAGKMLGISRATLYRKLKRYSIPLRSVQKDLVAAVS